MIIRDFDVVSAYVPDDNKIKAIIQDKSISEKEATIEYINQWKSLASEFKFQTRCTVSMFRRLLGKSIKADCKKIVVECVENVIDNRSINYTGIRTVQIQYNFLDFFSLTSLEKKKRTLEILMEGIQKISDLMKWDIITFKQAYNEVVERNYQNHWIWKEIRSPTKRENAELWIIHEIDDVKLVLVIRDIDGIEISREVIVSDKPDELIFNKYLGTFQWENDSKVTLVAKSGEFLPDGSYSRKYWKWSSSQGIR